MEDFGKRKNSEAGITEEDSRAGKPAKESKKYNDGITVDDERRDLELKTDVESEFKDKVVPDAEETHSDTETLGNKKTGNKPSTNVSIPPESTSRDKRESETESPASPPGKEHKVNGEEIEGESVAKEGKRKRRISSVQGRDSSIEKSERVNKRKRSKSNEDNFCWRCHKESVDSQCTACPRAWHRRCMGGAGPQPSPQNWICGECATILKAENAETRSPSMAQMSVEQLCTLLKHVVGRMRDYPGSEPFWKAVDLEEVPNYLDYVVKPMDLTLLESNVSAKLYGSTEAFMADAKWIQHNCIVFNTCGGVYTDTSKLTNAARQIIKAARQEVSEIEACPDCYGHSRNLPRPQPAWFVEPCRRPHPLVWAKLKGFPFWPAKAMSRVNGQGHVDVRFFGAHDRAWVPPRDLFLYSEDPPAPLPRKRKSDMDECVREITRHCRKLELAFGQFKFAPPKIQYNPRDPSQIKLMLPNYDPLQLKNSSVSSNASSRRKPPLRKRVLILKKRSPTAESIVNTSDSANDSTSPRGDSGSDCEKYIEASRIPKGSSLSNKLNQSKSSSANKHNNVKNVPENSNENGNSLRVKKSGGNRRKSIISVNTDSLLDDNVKTDDDVQTERDNQSLNKSSDGHSSSENELSLDIRQSLKSDTSASHRGKNPPVENASKSHSSQHNDNGAVQDSKMKMKNSPKTNRNQIRVYKPKTRMVNQVNAERAKARAKNRQKELTGSIDNSSFRKDETATSLSVSECTSTATTSDTSMTSGVTAANFFPNANNTDPNFSNTSAATASRRTSTLSNLETPAKPSTAPISLATNGIAESGKKARSTRDSLVISETPTVIKQEPKESQQHSPQKKESKARKSFLNKPPVHPQIPPLSPPKAPASPPDAMVYIPGHRTQNESDYLLLPPEAGPLSAQLHRGGQELARRMAQLMEEALAKAAQINSNHPDNSETNQRAMVHHLRLQIERMRWQHQQHLAELKHNTDLTLREMRSSLEAETYRAVEETKREAEEERLRSIEETKRKQWCALCGNEALFYCCWNTAYCDYPCQQAHWSTHMRTCAQNSPPNSIITATANVSQQQVMPRLVIPSPHASSNVWGA